MLPLSPRIGSNPSMQPEANSGWPTIPLSIAGALITAISVVLLLDLTIEADVYGLLGHDDDAVQMFDKLSARAPGLEEMLVVCDTGVILDRGTLAQIAAIDGVTEHTRSYLAAGN
jgi:hypothetical protein